ncbi:MAG: NUDIX domain-containing protein [Patescibacteria group bacterium]
MKDKQKKAKQRFTVRAAVYLVLIRDNHILLLRRFNTGWKDGWYSLVAGHLDGDETVFQAMMREAKEEAGLTIEEKDLSVVHVMHRNVDIEYVDFYLAATAWEGSPHIGEPEKCDDLRWFSLDSLPKNLTENVRQTLEQMKEKNFFSLQGWNKLIEERLP